MDKTARIILGLAVAIIYPILVITGVTLAIKSEVSESRPQYPPYQRLDYSQKPVCQQTSTNSFYIDENGDRQYTTNPGTQDYYECLNDQKEYEQKLKDVEQANNDAQRKYEQEIKEYDDAKNNILIFRSIAVLVIATVTVIICYTIRKEKELAGGLVIGSSLMVSGSIITLATVGYESDYIQLVTSLILVSFIVFTVLIRLVDMTIDKKFPVTVLDSDEPSEGNNKISENSEKTVDSDKNSNTTQSSQKNSETDSESNDEPGSKEESSSENESSPSEDSGKKNNSDENNETSRETNHKEVPS